MFDMLNKAAATHPVSGNTNGSYLTLASEGGIIFGIINVVGNFGTVFVDQAYWQRAIAARPLSTVKAYLVQVARLLSLYWYLWPLLLLPLLN
jgi:Na+/proline symporter